jgi:hypothetical protein
MVVVDRTGDEPLPQLVVGRRPVPLAWTPIVTLDADGTVDLHPLP